MQGARIKSADIGAERQAAVTVILAPDMYWIQFGKTYNWRSSWSYRMRLPILPPHRRVPNQCQKAENMYLLVCTPKKLSIALFELVDHNSIAHTFVVQRRLGSLTSAMFARQTAIPTFRTQHENSAEHCHYWSADGQVIGTNTIRALTYGTYSKP